jgi:hypothetical protein
MSHFRTPARHRLALAAGWLAALPAFAHEGHGAEGAHWHATDVFGFVLLAAVAVGLVAWWRGRR